MKIAFLFAGQGAQYVGMGKELYESSEICKKIFDMGEDIRPGTLTTCFCGPAEELTRTVNTQPCLFLCDLACAEALRSNGISPDVCAGFSLGELPALAFCGILSASDAFRTVVLRGETMDRCASEHPGGMAAALKLPFETVEEICSHYANIYPVNYNCPGQLSCAGAPEEMDAFCNEIKSAGGRAVKLAVSGAFHTPYMKAATEALSELLKTLEVSSPSIPLYSDIDATLYSGSADTIRDTVARQASRSVRWVDILKDMRKGGVDTFIEVGAGKTLSGFVNRTFSDDIASGNVRVFNVSDADTLNATLQALK